MTTVVRGEEYDNRASLPASTDHNADNGRNEGRQLAEPHANSDRIGN